VTAPAWREYQDDVAAFFRSLGFDAEVEQTLDGVRGRHNVDLVLHSQRAGVSQLWVVECKKWGRPVGKDRVLTLSGVVADVGADRGLLLSESGFQAGAIRVAETSNITLTSLDDLRESTADERSRLEAQLALHRIVVLTDRLMRLRTHEQVTRGGHRIHLSKQLPGVDLGLDMVPLMGRLAAARECLTQGLANLLPSVVGFNPDGSVIIADSLERAVAVVSELADGVEPLIADQERRAEAARVSE
jgi:hypothetical protein